MRNVFILVLLFSLIVPAAPARAQGNAAVPVASYSIQVRLDPDSKQLTGSETISYTNVSSDTIPDLVFHLYLNAFKDLNTIYMKEAGSAPRGFSYDANNPGWIQVDSITTVRGQTLTLVPEEDGTLARADLPAPLQPGETIRLNVAFTARLPKVFARTGFATDAEGGLFFMVGQWFPKLGVWENGGWNAYPFHANAEFFADFGTYDVAITLPSAYVTGGTGMPVGQVDNGDGTQTVSYHAENVIDFAWAASPNFKSASRQVGGTEAVYLYLTEHADTVERALDIMETSLTDYGQWYGAYPYQRFTVVDVPASGMGAGGMEYPTLVTGESAGLLGEDTNTNAFVDRNLELVISHEIGHQWWQSMVAFNEAEEPWLDEGFTDYSAARLFDKTYPGGKALEIGGAQVSYFDMRRAEYLMTPDIPMNKKSWDYTFSDYGVAAYSKPALSLSTLEGVLGEPAMLEVMSTFFDEYQYRHPTTADFRKTAESVSGQDLSWFFDGLVDTGETVNYRVKAVDAHEAVLEKQGDLQIPVQVRVEFAGGEVLTDTWDAKTASTNLSFGSAEEIQSVEVDPNHAVKVDLNWSDNGMSRQVNVPSLLAILVRLIYQIQNIVLSLGGL